MKRRAISLLAILAILCTMAVFAMPATVAAAENYPQYKDHVSAMANGHDGKNWSISEPADWLAMIETAGATAVGETYFDGVTFHLTQNINFNNVAMLQLGTAEADTDKTAFPRYFSGTINGHGYGFDNILIKSVESVTSGLINRLGNCSFIDFGVNSGDINRNSGNASTSVSTFGAVSAGCTVNFTRVWSGANVRSLANGHASALVGAPAEDVEATINVNGFVFDGLLAIDRDESTDPLHTAYGVVGSSSNDITGTHSYRNILVDGVVSNPKKSGGSINASASDYVDHAEPTPPFGMFEFVTKKPAVFENIYGIIGERGGLKKLATPYFIGTVAQSDDALLKTDAMEAAWTINRAQTGEGPDAVYYELNDEGKIRPIAEGRSEGKIVGITVEIENITKNVCVKPGSTVDLKAALGYTSEVSFTSADCTIDGTEVTVGTDDVTVQMTNSCVDHDFDYEQGDKKHTAVCSECNHQVTEDCTLTNCTQNALDWNAYTHTGTCNCGNGFSEVCDYVYTKTESGYKYICSCGRTADAAAPMVAGDVTEDGAVDLIDAIRLLKKAVGQSVTINERNADVDGDNDCKIADVRKIILYFMNVSAAKAEFEAAEARVNGANFYNEETTESGNLKMDGKEGTNERYVRTEYISVSEGNKIVFGPVRKTQAVLGHFYDADGNAIELINVNNEKLNTEYAFKATIQEKDVEIQADGSVVGELKTKEVDGMLMVSITAPEGAAYVRLQANAKEEDQFYIRINNEFSLADYQCRTNSDANALTNIEKDQMFLVVGDSLCSAAADPTDKGWRGRIVRDYGVVTSYSAQGGSALSTIRYLKANDDANLDTDTNINSRQCIVNQINEWRDSGRPFEYILLEGGGNDCSQDAEVGYWLNDDPSTGVKLFNPTSYDPKDFAPESTFVGGLERAIYSAIKTYGDTAAIGFMSIYDGPYYGTSGKFAGMGKYFEHAQEICDKWGVPYLDLYTILDEEKFNSRPMTEGKANYDPAGLTIDGIHANPDGYDVMQEYIGPFVTGIVPEEMKDEITDTMRPVDQEIFLEIQQYADLDKVIGPQK
ncbi:MAG: hypothetical protein IJO92_02215 [Clostridia bacterium]|nr:hypothetical protein [Clostridia bacterium]